MRALRIALAQLNTTVGDIAGNASRIEQGMARAASLGADLVVFPELALTGYPPEDLLLKSDFTEAAMRALNDIAASASETAAVVGFVDAAEDNYNAAAVLHRGGVAAVYRKTLLPNYGVFDENRYFAEGSSNLVIVLAGVRLGITICEDMWFPGGPVEETVRRGGAEIIVNLSASPFYRGREVVRRNLVEARALDGPAVIAYTNMVGGQDELVFDGGSMIYHPTAGMLAMGARFAEDMVVADVDVSGIRATRMREPRQRYQRAEDCRGIEVVSLGGGRAGSKPELDPRTSLPEGGETADVHAALVLGLSDYVRKNGFERVCIALSGGIDSSLVAALAVQTLGAEKVTCVFMPSRITSELSERGARELVANLGCGLEVYPIEQVLDCYLESAGASLAGPGGGVARENLQARIRGNIMMNISNSRGGLVLATGNKSELSTGYCTLYGDMVGGFALLKDVLKTGVYELAHYVNRISGYELIPAYIIARPPTAELSEGQEDTDHLPPYDVLDPILEAYVERGLPPADIAAAGFDEETVARVTNWVDTNEYKRRQAPVGIKITPRAFGRDWRMPISKYAG
ncbi:MAG: NAD+ synthase [Candidatus Geothermincolia bacterium]